MSLNQSTTHIHKKSRNTFPYQTSAENLILVFSFFERMKITRLWNKREIMAKSTLINGNLKINIFTEVNIFKNDAENI